ncbi:hypothetical protein [Haloarcula sp. CBA1129]|nr:hypothetical protein [Haloarcula sp. CBA1129]
MGLTYSIGTVLDDEGQVYEIFDDGTAHHRGELSEMSGGRDE